MAEPSTMSGNDVINYALTLHGILYVGQTPGANALLACQTHLNNMLAEWNAQGKAVFSVVLNSYGLTAGVSQYTLGTGGTAPSGSVNLSTTRAEKIESWGVHGAASGSDGGKPVSATDFESARSKLDEAAATLGLLPASSALINGGLSGGRVKLLNYDANFPEGTVTIYPVPGPGLVLDLWTWDQIVAIADFTLAMVFPPGYLKAIAYNLACELAPLFGHPLDPNVQRIADQSKATLGGTNISELTRLDPMTVPPAAR